MPIFALNTTFGPLEYTFFALAGLYFVLIIIPFVQLLRLRYQAGLPWTKSTTQKMFLIMLLVNDTFRTIYFVLVPFTAKEEFHVEDFNRTILTILDDLGDIFFFTTFALLILFWAEIIHHARHHASTQRLRAIYVVFNVLVYVFQASIWVSLMLLPEQKLALNRLDSIFFAVLSLVAAFGFLYFGGQLFFLLKRNPIDSKGRTNKLREVACVTIICSVCFSARCCMTLLLTWQVQLETMWSVLLVYYLVVEVAPALLVIFVLRKLPPRYSAVPVSSAASSQAYPRIGSQVYYHTSGGGGGGAGGGGSGYYTRNVHPYRGVVATPPDA